jgi:ABC-2 type transport system permease protein
MTAARMTRQLGVPAALSARRLLADRGGLAVSVLFYLVVVSALSALWRAATATSGGAVAGYSAVALTWYIATSEASICAIQIRLIEEIGDEIASGAVAVELLRPFPVVAVRLAVQTGRALGRLAWLIGCGAVFALLVAGPPPEGRAALLAIPSLVLAVAANVALQHAVAAMAFWLRDARSAWFIYQKFVFILGGMLLPLQVLPAGLHAVASWLPFMAMAYAPARIASGHVEPSLLLVQAFWLVVLVGAATAAFGAGQRRLQVVGG